MKKLFAIGAVVLCGHIAGMSHAQAGENVNQAWVTQNLTSMPLAFTQNMGQWPDSILFRADAGEAVIWFVQDGIYYQYTRWVPKSGEGDQLFPPQAVGHPDRIDPVGRDRKGPDMVVGRDPRGFDLSGDSIETTMIKAEFVGASPDVEVAGLDELQYKCNYFIGDDPAKWRTDVPNFIGITFRGLYPGVDASFGERDGRLECRLTAATPADLAQVRTEYHSAGAVTKETENTVSIQTAVGEKRFAGILPLDETGPAKTVIASTESPDAGVSLLYSTYLGGNNWDEGFGIAVDGSGNAYVTGFTLSTNFPTQNPYQTEPRDHNYDVFVTKLSAAGNSLLYSTYLGGSDVLIDYGIDYGYGIAVDGSGNAYVTGFTQSTDFPIQNQYQVYQGPIYQADVFVTKLSAAGNSLLYSTYLGGNGTEHGYGIAVDGSGNAYVTGYTNSTNFPTQNPYQTDQGTSDAFVTKLSAAGNSLLYSTYLGGNISDWGQGIAVDGSGNAYVTGWTSSTDFPTQNPYQTDQTGNDVFVSKLSAAGNSLLYSTYLGGNSHDYGWGIAVDGSGNAYVTGETWSSNFPTQNPYQTDPADGDRDVFVTKLSAAGNSLLYSTYLGGDFDERGFGIAVDASGNAYVTGRTWSTNFPTQNQYQVYQGPSDYPDVFVTKLSATGNSLLYSTYLGGNSHDGGSGIAVDGSGSAYVTGYTSSTDFPTQNQYQVYQGPIYQADVFVTKLSVLCCAGRVGDANGSNEPTDEITLGDIMLMVDALFISGDCSLLPCVAEADVNQDGGTTPNCDEHVTLGDIMALVDFLFITGPETATLKDCL